MHAAWVKITLVWSNDDPGHMHGGKIASTANASHAFLSSLGLACFVTCHSHIYSGPCPMHTSIQGSRPK